MKGLNSLIRVRQWELDEKRKAVVALQQQQDQIRAAQEALEEEIILERQKAAEDIEIGRVFSAYYQAAIERRFNLKTQFDALDVLIEQAREAMADAFQNAKQFELVKDSLDAQEAAELAAKEAEALDEIGLNLHRRKKEP